MKYAELNELHTGIIMDLEMISDICSNLNDIDVNQLQRDIKELWKQRGRKDLVIRADQIKDTVKELDVLFDVSKECGIMDEIKNSDLDDFGRAEPEDW